MSWYWLADPTFRPPASARGFAQEFRRLQAEVEQALKPLKVATDPGAPVAKQEAMLLELNEYQTRWYFIDGILALLGWLGPIERSNTFGAHPHLTVEQRLHRVNTDRYHWLDYAGFEVAPNGEASPLLAVEAKRHEGADAWSLPQRILDGGHIKLTTGQLLDLLTEPPPRSYPSSLTDQSPRPDHATVAHLEQLREYCVDMATQPAGIPPRVALLSNGYSHIAIVEVEKWTRDARAGVAHVFPSPDDVVFSATEFWRLLSFNCVASGASPLDLGQLRAIAQKLPHGWSVRYCNAIRVIRHGHLREGSGDVDSSEMVVAAVPAIALVNTSADGGSTGRLIWVDVRAQFARIPNDSDELVGEHLSGIARQHTERRRQVSCELCAPRGGDAAQTDLETIELSEIDALFPEGLALVGDGGAVGPTGTEAHVILLGDETHLIRCDETHHPCRSHRSEAPDICTGTPQLTSSFGGRCHFPAGSVYHCAHHFTLQLKQRSASTDYLGERSYLGEASLQRLEAPYGRRSNPVFCELWSVDRYLCCRQCAYWEICRDDLVGLLPCTRDD